MYGECSVLSYHMSELLNFYQGWAKGTSEFKEERDPGLCRAVIFPLVSSQALWLEWIGLDMPLD